MCRIRQPEHPFCKSTQDLHGTHVVIILRMAHTRSFGRRRQWFERSLVEGNKAFLSESRKMHRKAHSCQLEDTHSRQIKSCTRGTRSRSTSSSNDSLAERRQKCVLLTLQNQPISSPNRQTDQYAASRRGEVGYAPPCVRQSAADWRSDVPSLQS